MMKCESAIVSVSEPSGRVRTMYGSFPFGAAELDVVTRV